jgi:hypothetical protein
MWNMRTNDAVIADVLLSEKSEMEERTMADLIDRQALRLMKTEECAGHSIEYAMGWKACIEWIRAMPSAEPEQKWIPFTKRELTAEEQEEHPEWCYIMECPLPDDGQEILVSDGRRVWQDEFYVDDDGCYLDSDSDFDGCAWMPKPEPYKEGE